MTIERVFSIKARVNPPLETHKIIGGFSCGAFDAAQKFADIYIPGAQVIPGGVHYNLYEHRFELHPPDGAGGYLYVTEE